MAADLLGAAALLVTALTVAPQIVRVVRTGRVAGVSPTWTSLGAVSTAAWVGYLALDQLWWPAVADAIVCVSYVATFWLLRRREVAVRHAAGVGLVWLVTFAGVAVVGGRSGVGILLSVAFAVQVTPSVWTAYTASSVDGVSIAAWLLIGLEGLLWGSYGLLVDDGAVIAFGVIAIMTSVLMVGRLHAAGRTGSTTRGNETVGALPRERTL